MNPLKDGKYVMEYRHEESSLQRAIVEGRHEVLVAAYQDLAAHFLAAVAESYSSRSAHSGVRMHGGPG